MVRQHPRRVGRKLAAGASVLLVVALVLGLRTDMPATDFAREACRDLAESATPSRDGGAKVEDELTQATARARRASATDASFASLYAGLRTIRDAVTVERVPPRVEEAAATALSDVVETCAELVPDRPGGVRLADLTVRGLREMWMAPSGDDDVVLGGSGRAS